MNWQEIGKRQKNTAEEGFASAVNRGTCIHQGGLRLIFPTLFLTNQGTDQPF
ncbi:hypothetical protein GN277_27295 [Lachnospiraceae bacterium WCA-9-b2]|uniref:Uncharacterized protein n=1 Tax=Sporofaciens musculi TaxID=2681861 RepID=A0A7X3SHB5_9FIRM|nr:hypothetical protein [Sporofaciens musculi]MXP73916.1 hypothetical protein [Sporofaciens musculi]MXP78903.1 hypothetical protein [Sporofaciens musculi]